MHTRSNWILRILFAIGIAFICMPAFAFPKPIPGCAKKMIHYYQAVDVSKSKTCRGLFTMWLKNELHYSICEKAFTDVMMWGLSIPFIMVEKECFMKCSPRDFKCWHGLKKS